MKPPIYAFFFLILCFVTGCESSNYGYQNYPWLEDLVREQRAQEPPQSLPQTPLEEEEGQIENIPALEGAVNAAYVPEVIPNLPPAQVALLLPLSGPQSPMGESMLKAAQMALFDAGHTTFELRPYDTQGKAATARKVAQDAIDAGAQLILGPVFAESARAVGSVARRANVNMVAFTTNWNVAGGNSFVMGFLPFDQIDRLSSYVAAQGPVQVGVIAPDTAYGRAVSAAYQSASVRYPAIEIADQMLFPARSSNLAPDLRRFTKYDERFPPEAKMRDETHSEEGDEDELSIEDLIANGEEIDLEGKALMPPPFEAVLMPMGGETARAVGNLLSHYELPPSAVRRLGTGLFDDPGLATEQGLDGAWFAGPDPALRNAFEQRFHKLYGVSPVRLATLAYDATALSAVLARYGLERYGAPAFDAGALGNPNGFAGLDGIFRFRPNGTVERGLAILEFYNGRMRVIDPAPQTFEVPETLNPAPAQNDVQLRTGF